MKWGVRRYQYKDGSLTSLGKKRATSGQVSQTKERLDAASGIVRETKNVHASVTKIRSTSAKKDAEKEAEGMSDQELKEKVKRLELEQKYANLSSKTTSKGEVYVKNTLEVAGSVLAIGASAATIWLAIQKAKG
jgi:hypothetical protein